MSIDARSRRIVPVIAVVALASGAAGFARAAAAPGDDAAIAACRDELAERLFDGAARGEAFIIAQEIEHRPEGVAIRLVLASGEGRRIAGTCSFRAGRLFDVKVKG